MPTADLDLTSVSTLLCDADGTLFASEEPAFDASVTVTNRALESFGAAERFTSRSCGWRPTARASGPPSPTSPGCTA